jgi:hypothetical protein
MTITSQIQHKYLKHAAAPCPNCGWLQSYMIDLNGEFATPHWSEKCLLAGIALGIASAGLLAFNVNKFYGAGAQPDSYEPVYWFADLAVFLSALGCGVAHLCFINRRPDPNRAPLETRLKKGKFMGMPLDEYETLINAEGSAPARPGISSTGIQAPRTSAEAPTGSQEMP